ncbi:immunoglobulin superfamily member 3-like isoform X2 [Acipenser ruthenus]|uniref:immunoglobulin superfamily member 3-like isoform X2 n=1 Tax=Acipenser ruthenus TaxID=7906 RepID=UPI0027426924|nr:immunoglobulin superfamily member 3-like isoform X2 [Acipenser ruthenus]
MVRFNIAMNHQRTSLLCFLTFLLLWDYSASQRTVQIQQGRLYRAKGYPVIVSCNVSGYETNTQQEFEFSFFSPDNPQQEINIISTKDTNFAYAKYGGRVRQNDIFIDRRSKDSVLLHIRKLVDGDTGEYECHTPNTDSKYFGTYNDKMNLTVIEDTLEATLGKETLNKFEGDPLQLKCEVSKQTLQHTHISVTWYLNKTPDLRVPIISLMRDFVLNPGSEYRARYEAGHIGLDKIGETTYRLSISQLQQSDQGQIYCEAGEWIQDPDRSWYQIASKTTAATTVNVQSVGKDFNTQIVTNQGPLTEGDTLEIRCTVEAQNIPDRYFSVVWLRNNEKMASFGPTGVLDIGDSYTTRESNRQVKVVKKSNSDYLFIAYHVSKEDSGTYQCRVTEMEKGSGENFISKTPKSSSEVVLDIRSLRSVLTAELKSRTINVKDTETITLQCKVKGPKVPLTITWTFMAKGSQAENIVVIHYDGKITWGEKTSNFKFKTIVEKTESDSNLKITRASSTEMGKYQCVAEAWINEVQLANVYSNELEVIVSKPVSKLSISSEPMTIKSKVNANVEIECKITASTYQDSQFEVSWYASKYDEELSNKTILKTDRNNILMPEELMNSHEMKNKYQSKRCSRSSYKLSILQTDLTDSGKYYCVVEEWLQDANNIWYSLDKKSVEIEVDIASIENKLQVSKTNATMIVHENKEFEVNCTFSSEVQSASQFSVTWYYQNSSYTKKPLLKLKHNSMFEFLGGDKELMKRMQFYSPSVGTYSLVIQKADVGDSGIYSCQVDEWIMNSKNQLHFQSSDVSGFTNVEIHYPEKKLHVHKSDVSISLVEKQGSFKLKCSIDSISSRESTFEVTWWKRTEQGENQAIFIAQRNSTLRFLNGTKSILLFERPTAKLYTLTVQRAEVTDSGSYYCRVKELLLSPRNQWHEIAADTSGTSTVDIKQEEHSIFSTVCTSQSLFSFVFIYPFIVIVLLIMVMLYLYYKLWKAEGTHKSCKENGPSLWPERDPLKYFKEIDAQDENPNGGDVEMNSGTRELTNFLSFDSERSNNSQKVS